MTCKHVLALFAAGLAVAACERNGTGPDATSADSRVAYVAPGAQPQLFIQGADGAGRIRVRFDGAEDRIEGNIGQDQLPVKDAQIKAIGPVKWSPDGRSLAVVLTLAHDQSEIVVVGADGRNAKVASPNSQIILSDIAWSSDSRRIAYTMSTRPHATGIDVFVTDLGSSSVQRVTDGAELGIAGVELAWSDGGGQLYWTRQSGEQGSDGFFNPLTTIYRYDLASSTMAIVESGLVGFATGLARGGVWVLLVRNTGRDGQDYARSLVRRMTAGDAETVLVQESERVLFAELTPTQCRAVVALERSSEPQTPAFSYRVLPTRGGNMEPLLQTADLAAVDAFFSREDC